MLDSLNIMGYSEQELWFKLLVMHVYHAGSYNVQSALFTFKPEQGSINLIYKLWQAQTARFKNASQNYSQLVLAAMLEMNWGLRKKTAPPGRQKHDRVHATVVAQPGEQQSDAHHYI